MMEQRAQLLPPGLEAASAIESTHVTSSPSVDREHCTCASSRRRTSGRARRGQGLHAGLCDARHVGTRHAAAAPSRQPEQINLPA